MPPTSSSGSVNNRLDEPEDVRCKCRASSTTKRDSCDDEPEGSSQEIARNPSETVGLKIAVLNLSGQGLTSFPDAENLANLTVLNLSNNSLSELPSSLKSARFLRCLNVSWNKLKEFPNVLRDGLRILKELNLSHNAIGSLERPACYQHLTELRAGNCELSEFPCWILYDLHFLEVLDLSLNCVFLRVFPKHRVFHQSCNNLLRVDFSNTYMSDGHLHVISHFKRLTHLDVSNYSHKHPNSFAGFRDHLPSGLKVLKAVNIRMVEKLNLTELQLEKMNLSGNSLVLLNEVNVSVHIRFLVLSECYLSLLPDNFGDMVHLEYLNLSHNDLDELPESFANLTELVHLDLYKNSFREFPLEQLRPLKKITCFDMCLNPVDVPPYPLGEQAPSYERLKATLRSALNFPRKSGKVDLPTYPESDGYDEAGRSRWSGDESNVDDEESEAAKSSSSSPKPNFVKREEGEEEEEEDWGAVDPNGIYEDASSYVNMGGLNRTRDLFAGIYDEDHFLLQLRLVPPRIRDSPFFYYRTSYAILPPRRAVEEETVAEGQFDD